MNLRAIQNKIFTRAKYKLCDDDPVIAFLVIAEAQGELYARNLKSSLDQSLAANRTERANLIAEIGELRAEAALLKSKVAEISTGSRKLIAVVSEIYKKVGNFLSRRGHGGKLELDTSFDPGKIRITADDLDSIEATIQSSATPFYDENERVPDTDEYTTPIGGRYKPKNKDNKKK